MKTGPVIVASDFSGAADEAIRQAHERALSTKDRLVVVHVVPRAIQMHAFFPQVNPLAIDDILERRKALGPKLVERVVSLTGRAESDFEVALEAGEPYLEIVNKAEDLDASLIVVGNHGASGFDRILLGSVSERVVRYAHSPVWVARPRRTGGGILAATDFSDPATPALEAAFSLGKERGIPITVLHVLDVEPSAAAVALAPLGAAPPVPTRATVEAVRQAAESTLSDLARRFDAEAEQRIEQGHAAETILKVLSEGDFDLVVVGSRGRTGLRRLTLGSVAEQVVRKAPCSVLTVRLQPSE